MAHASRLGQQNELKSTKQTNLMAVVLKQFNLVYGYWGGNYFAHGRFPEVGEKQ